MRVYDTIAEFRSSLDEARAAGRRVGLVPTMGFLHEGHASLMRAAAADNDEVAATIFVNPLQFAAGEDLESYPRDLARDLTICESAGVTHLLTPSAAEMYPRPIATTVSVAGVSAPMEGASRPHFFDGVATVVAKLFNICGPCRAYFGEKDYQQLLVVRRMAADLDFPVEVVGCPIVREPDGLAMSSRNVYLGPAERQAATVLSRALEAGSAAIDAGEVDPLAVEAVLSAAIAAEPLAELDYAAVVDPETLDPPERITGPVRLLVAARVGPARLIDNRSASPG